MSNQTLPISIPNFLEFEVYPKLDRKALLEPLSPSDRGDYLVVNCPQCKQHEAFLYKDSNVIVCNRKNNCGYRESIWDFVKSHFNYTTGWEVINHLAKLAGVTVPATAYDEQAVVQSRQRASVMEAVYEHFLLALQKENELSDVVRYYLAERDIEDAEAYEMGFGVVTPREEIEQKLETSEFPIDTVRETLDNIYYDKRIGSSHVVVLPYRDPAGNIIGFVCRTTYPDIKPKYLYTKGLKIQTSFFNFRPHRKLKKLLVVEGVIDSVVATYRLKKYLQDNNISLAEPINIVGCGGDSVREEQMKNARKHGIRQMIFALDNDTAGNRGTFSSINLAYQYDIRPFVFPALDKELNSEEHPDMIKDPDEFIKIHGIENFYDYYLKAYNASRWYAIQIAYKHDITTDIGKEEAIAEAIPVYDKIEDTVDAEMFLDTIASCLDIDQKLLYPRFLDVQRKQKRQSLVKDVASLYSNGLRMYQNGEHDKMLETLFSHVPAIKARSNVHEVKPYTFNDFETAVCNIADGLRTGYKELDYAINIKPGTLTYVAGRPSHGKSTVLMNIAVNQVRMYKEKVFLFFTLEEPKHQIIMKMLNMMASFVFEQDPKHPKMPNSRILESYIRNKRTNEYVIEQAKKQLAEILESKRLWIIEDIKHIEDIAAFIADMSLKYDIGGVYIDYIQKMRTHDRSHGSRQLALQAISATTLDTAQTYMVPIILGAQLGRGKEIGKEGRAKVRLDNLREAGDIENDAAIVLGIWNEAKEQVEKHGDESGDGERKNIEIPDCVDLEIITLKNRDGRTGQSFMFKFDRPILKVSAHSQY